MDILWFGALTFGAGMLFRLWWVAALITAAGVAMFWPRGGEAVNFAVLVCPALMFGLPAFAGAALGKFVIKRRAQDPFDPQNPR